MCAQGIHCKSKCHAKTPLSPLPDFKFVTDVGRTTLHIPVDQCSCSYQLLRGVWFSHLHLPWWAIFPREKCVWFSFALKSRMHNPLPAKAVWKRPAGSFRDKFKLSQNLTDSPQNTYTHLSTHTNTLICCLEDFPPLFLFLRCKSLHRVQGRTKLSLGVYKEPQCRNGSAENNKLSSYLHWCCILLLLNIFAGLSMAFYRLSCTWSQLYDPLFPPHLFFPLVLLVSISLFQTKAFCSHPI